MTASLGSRSELAPDGAPRLAHQHPPHAAQQLRTPGIADPDTHPGAVHAAPSRRARAPKAWRAEREQDRTTLPSLLFSPARTARPVTRCPGSRQVGPRRLPGSACDRCTA